MPVYIGNKKVSVNPKIVKNEGPSLDGEFLVQVIDYDGTVLKMAMLDEGDTFTLPDPPSHTGLTFQEWSSPVTITNNTVTVTNSDITIGAVYYTTSGLSEFDITLNEGIGLTVILNMSGNKNWGDGTTDTEKTHTYSSYGSYLITCDGDVSLPSDKTLFGDYDSPHSYVINVRFASNVTFPSKYNVVSNCHYLRTIILPANITILDKGLLNLNYSLKSIVIPPNVTKVFLGSLPCLQSVALPLGLTQILESFFECSLLESITIPETVTTMDGDYGSFYKCSSLKRLKIPDNLTDLYPGYEGGFAEDCLSLEKVVFGENVEYLSESSFRNCPNVMEYDFSNCTSIPSMDYGYNMFTCSPGCVIKVPASLYDEWIVSTNWVNYANYIVAV